jgi:hypothetical protein
MTGAGDRTRWIEHRAKAILFYDFAGLEDTEAGLAAIAARTSPMCSPARWWASRDPSVSSSRP